MKKLILSTFFMSCLALAGCNTSVSTNGVDVKDEYYQEYTVKNVLDSTAKTKVVEEIKKNSINLSNISASYKAESSNNLGSSSAEYTYTYKFSKDNSNPNALIANVDESVTSKLNNSGIIYEETKTYATRTWDSLDGYRVVDRVESSNSTAEHKYSKESTSSDQKDTYVSYLLEQTNIDLSELSFYKNDNNSYIAIYSYVSKRVTAVEWGKETKESVEMSKRQTVMNFTSDYKIIDGYSYRANYSNQDGTTGEWYNEVKRQNYSYMSFTGTYGTKDNASIISLNNGVRDVTVSTSVSLQGYIADTTSSSAPYTIDGTSMEGPNSLYDVSVDKKSDNEFTISYDFSLSKWGYYNLRGYALEVKKTVAKFSGSDQVTTHKVTINLATLDVDPELVKVATYNGYYFVINNTSSSYLYGHMTISFVNNVATVTAVSLNNY